MRKRIGEFFIEKGVLTEEQVDLVLRYSQRSGLRFGEAALELSFLSREKLLELFGPSFHVDFFHLDPTHFPEATRDLLSVEVMLRSGAMPLGFKQERGIFGSRKVLNLGFLNPSDARNVKAMQEAAQAKLGPQAFQGVKIFLLVADQFLDTLDKVYGIGAPDIKERDPHELNETLQLFIDGTIARPSPIEGEPAC